MHDSSMACARRRTQLARLCMLFLRANMRPDTPSNLVLIGLTLARRLAMTGTDHGSQE